MSEAIEKVPTHYRNNGDVIKITESKLYLVTSYFDQIFAGTTWTTIFLKTLEFMRTKEKK